MDYPTEPLESMFPSFKAKESSRSLALLWGLILSFGGIAVIFGRDNLQSGSIILALGAALLLYHFLVKGRPTTADDKNDLGKDVSNTGG
jgi:hypothetical protein